MSVQGDRGGHEASSAFVLPCQPPDAGSSWLLHAVSLSGESLSPEAEGPPQSRLPAFSAPSSCRAGAGLTSRGTRGS